MDNNQNNQITHSILKDFSSFFPLSLKFYNEPEARVPGYVDCGCISSTWEALTSNFLLSIFLFLQDLKKKKKF